MTMSIVITPGKYDATAAMPTRRLVLDTIAAYNAALDDAKLTPDGHDFSDLQTAIDMALDSGAVPIITAGANSINRE